MIIGLGSDMVDVRRIARSIERHGERFLGRIFTAGRTRQGRETRQPGRNLRQAFRRQGSLLQGARHRFPQRRVLARHGRGQSALGASDHAADRRRAQAAAGDHAGRLRGQIDVSLTDEGPTAQAIVIISAGACRMFACRSSQKALIAAWEIPAASRKSL